MNMHLSPLDLPGFSPAAALARLHARGAVLEPAPAAVTGRHARQKSGPKRLTRNQKLVLQFLQQRAAAGLALCEQVEIARALNITSSSVYTAGKSLCEKGFARHVPNAKGAFEAVLS